MEDVQHQQPPLGPSFPPANKWLQDADGEGTPPPQHANDGGSFGQDSGYNSYQATTPNNTFNLSSRHGASGTLATIDEANELDGSLNDSSTGLSAVNLTPRTTASMELLANIHLNTPKTADRPNRARRPFAFDYDGTGGGGGGGGGGDGSSSFLPPSTPERLPRLCRSLSASSQETPLRTGNRSANVPAQLTPHKTKGGSHSLKRKLSSFREKLYSDGDVVLRDENQSRDLNDSFDADCRRLEDISPIPNVKRRKQYDRGIEDLMRSSTPKTASSQPTFLQLDTVENRPAGRKTLRKFQSFSPSKVQSAARPLLRSRPFRTLERTPEKKREHRVLAEIELETATESLATTAVAETVPEGFSALIVAPMLDDPSKQLEQTVTNVLSLDDFSLTPSKASLIDPELSHASSKDRSFAVDDCVARHVPNYSYAPTLNSILEESPIKAHIIPEKPRVPKTPPSISKSGRKLKRLGTNGTSSTVSCASSPARSVRYLSRPSVRASVSPKVRRSHGTQPNQSQKAVKRYSYCGFEYVNILHQLNKFDRDALGVVLEYLADTDLVQVVRVSSGWRSIIQNHKKCWARLQRYLKRQERHKENTIGSSSISSQPVHDTEPNGPCTSQLNSELNGTYGDGNGVQEEAIPVPTSDSVVPKRKPFKVCNYLERSHASSVGNASFGNVSVPELSHRRSSVVSGGGTSIGNVTQSPAISPSMQKFITNQKIATHLKQSEQLRPCPRCEQPSRIIFSRASKSASNKSRPSARSSAVGARLEKSYTLPDPDTTAYRSNDQNTHSSTIDTVRASLCAGVRNNNEYPQQSPDRVRKNLFNDSTAIETPPNLSFAVQQRMKLRSAAMKSFDCSAAANASCAGEDQLGVRDSKCDYAICSGQSCRFKFCIKCLCEYHPNTVCADLSANSPTKEEERGRPNVACSRQSRRSLQRLCRKS